jgi:hypothetical protein
MKKLEQSISKQFPPVVLYLEDLQELEHVLRESSKEITIQCDGFEFDSVAELAKEIGSKQINAMELRARDPYTCIELSNYKTSAYVGTSSIEGAGIFHLIAKILNRRTRWLPWIYAPFGSMFGFLFVLLLIFITGVAAGMGLILPLGLIIFFTVQLWAGWISLNRHSVIRVITRPTNFFSRNRDQLIIQLISGIFGAAFGATVALLYKWLYP